jgi:hypothetical protein
MLKVHDLVVSSKKDVPRTRKGGKHSFMSFQRASEEELKLAQEEKHQKELAKIAHETSVLRIIEEEREKAEIESNRITRTNSVNNRISNAFGTKTKIDTQPARQSAVDNILPKAFIPEQKYSEPFKEEPALNKELSEFKKKIHEHIAQLGLAHSSGGGAGFMVDLDDVQTSTAKVDGKFLKYSSSDGKWVGDTSDTFTVTANDSTNETVYPIFVDGATGSQSAESDSGLTYNPSTGLLTSTGFSGNLTGTLQTAAQGNVTSVGTLTGLVIADSGNIGSASDTDAITIDSSGNVTASQNLTVTGDLTVSGSSTTVNKVTINVEEAFVFEGATADSYETTLSVSDPTADRAIVLPDTSGQVQVIPPITLNGTDGSFTDAGDHLVLNGTDGASDNDGDQLLYEDGTSDVMAVFASHGITLAGYGWWAFQLNNDP